MADDLAAGGLDRGGAGVGGEVVLGGEAAHIADLAEQLGGQDGADAKQFGERGRRPLDGRLEAVIGCRDPPVQSADVGDQVDSQLPAIAERCGLWPHPAQQRGGAGSASSTCSRLRVWVRARAQVVAAIRQQAQHGRMILDTDLAKPPGARAATATETASWASPLRPWPTDSSRTGAANLVGTSTTD